MNAAAGSNPTIASNTVKSAKDLAKSVVGQLAREPWEILKQAGSEAMGNEQDGQAEEFENTHPGESKTAQQQQNEKMLSERDKIRSQRLVEALEAELKEIRQAKAQKELAQKRQEDIVKQEQLPPKPVAQLSSKPNRRLLSFGKKKSQVERQQTQTERPLPPSG